MLALRYGAATDVGLVRDHNEDSMWVSPQLFVVADGMGGHAAGEVASDLAVSEFSYIAKIAPLQDSDITAAFQRANDHILAASIRGDRFGMGTTLTGLAVVSADSGDQWAVFNVGDSRVYRFAEGTLRQLTIDHSEVQELIAAGQLARSQARYYPRRNVVTRSLGTLPAPVPDIWLLPPEAGERFLLCSDGLTGELDDDAIATILGEIADPRQAAEELVRQANEAGGRDNTTVVIVDLPAHSE